MGWILSKCNDTHILIFSNYSTQVSTKVSNAFHKPHFLMSDLYAWLWWGLMREENFLILSAEKQRYLDSYLEMLIFMLKKMSSVHGYGQDKVWKCWLSLSLVGGCMQNCLPLIHRHLTQCQLVSVLNDCGLQHIHNIFPWRWWCTVILHEPLFK